MGKKKKKKKKKKPRIISNVGSLGDDLQKKLKIKRGKDPCSKSPSQMNFLPRFRAGAGTFYINNLPS